METFTDPAGDTLTINESVITVEDQQSEATFTPAEEDRLAIVRALLGTPPPLQETLGSPEEMAKSKTEGELQYLAHAATQALEFRRAEMARAAKEAEEKERELRIEARKRIRQINLLEKAYLATQTGRRAHSTQASQNIAEMMYAAGARVPDPDEEPED